MINYIVTFGNIEYLIEGGIKQYTKAVYLWKNESNDHASFRSRLLDNDVTFRVIGK